LHYVDVITSPPREAEPALAAIRAAGGDELVRAMLGAFSAFATAQWAWIEAQARANAFEAVSIGARGLRISAQQIGAVAVAKACEGAELAAAARDAAAIAAALHEVAQGIADARPWLDAHAAE
jgi:HPt (histidine-containing phosphotransfer) domain-containing protein